MYRCLLYGNGPDGGGDGAATYCERPEYWGDQTRSRGLDYQRVPVRFRDCHAADGARLRHLRTAAYLYPLPGHLWRRLHPLWPGSCIWPNVGPGFFERDKRRYIFSWFDLADCRAIYPGGRRWSSRAGGDGYRERFLRTATAWTGAGGYRRGHRGWRCDRPVVWRADRAAIWLAIYFLFQCAHRDRTDHRGLATYSWRNAHA